MAGMNWKKYNMMPEDTVSGVDPAAMTDPNAFPQLDWMDALKTKRMSEGVYSPYATPFLGAENQGTQFDPYNQPKVDVRNPPQAPIDWNKAPNQGTLFDPYGGASSSRTAPTPNRPSEPAVPERTGGPTDWARNAANTGFNPTYQQSNPLATTPPIDSPRQVSARAPIPQVSRPSGPRLVASPTTQSGTPAPALQPSYTRQEPIDFAGLLSGAAKRGGGAFGDFGAAQMQGPEERAAQAAQTAAAERATNQPQMPQYDYGPMSRYQEYLKAEPDRDQYKPKGWGRILNSAAAGVQAYQTGDIGQGVKLGEYLNQQPYENAFKKWQSKGTRVAADATMAETRYKNQVEAFNKNADNARADYMTKLTERGVDLKEAEFAWKISEAKNNGWVEVTGNDGLGYLRKVVDGKPQIMATGMPAQKMNALMTMAEGQANRDQSNTNSVRSANTSIANTNANNTAADLRLGRNILAQGERQGIDINSRENMLGRTQTFQAGQNDATREVTRRGQDLQYPVGGRPVTSSNTSTASGLMQNKYPEFNNESVVTIRKNKPALNPKFKGSDDGLNNAEIVKYIGTLTQDPAKGKALFDKFKSMYGDLGSFNR